MEKTEEYTPDKPQLDLKERIYKLLRSLGYAIQEHAGIVEAESAGGECWDFTIPTKSKQK